MTSDNDLSLLLREWQASPAAGPGFTRNVWSRIEGRRQDGLYSIFSWLCLLARPRIATTAIAVALFGGVLIGGVQARGSQEERYLLSLKPFAVASIPR